MDLSTKCPRSVQYCHSVSTVTVHHSELGDIGDQDIIFRPLELEHISFLVSIGIPLHRHSVL